MLESNQNILNTSHEQSNIGRQKQQLTKSSSFNNLNTNKKAGCIYSSSYSKEKYNNTFSNSNHYSKENNQQKVYVSSKHNPLLFASSINKERISSVIVNQNQMQKAYYQNNHNHYNQLQKDIEMKKIKRNRSASLSGKIVKKGQKNHYENKQQSNFIKASDMIYNPYSNQTNYKQRAYETTLQRLKYDKNTNLFNHTCHAYLNNNNNKDYLINPSSKRTPNLALTSIMNYNFSSQIMNKTNNKLNYDKKNKNENSKLPQQSKSLSMKLNHLLRHNDEQNNQQKYKINIMTEKLTPYQYQHNQNQKLKNFQDRYNRILVSYQNKKRQLSQQFNKIEDVNSRQKSLINIPSKYQLRSYSKQRQKYRQKTKQHFQKTYYIQKLNSQIHQNNVKFASKFDGIINPYNQTNSKNIYSLSNFNTIGSSSKTIQISKQRFQFNAKKSQYPIQQLIKDTNIKLKIKNQKNQQTYDRIQTLQKDLNKKLQNIQRAKSLSMAEVSTSASSVKNKTKIKINNTSCQEFKQFFRCFEQYIKKQQKLRNFKHQIANHSKINQIASLLALKGINKQELALSAEQYDPFQGQNEKCQQISKKNLFQKSTQQLSNQYHKTKYECQQFWKSSILNCYDQDIMKRLFEKLDYSKKSQLSIKDFVRQYNCLVGKNFRMRDVYKIYERLKPMTKQNFIKKLSKIVI